MERKLHTEIEIAASAERVWQVLAEFKSYPEWNPLLRGMQGALTPGTRLRVSVRLAWWFRMIIHPVVLLADAPQSLHWKGSLIIPGLFAGVHAFEIQPVAPGRVKLVQSETFSGLLVPIILVVILGLMRQGFEAMNAATKEVAESSSHS